MCHAGFIVLSADYAASLCDYLLAKFIIFCILMGVAFLYMCLIPQVNGVLVAQLCFTALFFEVLALAIALFYLAGALLLVCEVGSSILLCVGCCCTIPLLDRARVRGVLDEDMMRRDCISFYLLSIACQECGHVLFFGNGRGVQPSGEVVVTVHPAIADKVVQLTMVTRMAINIV
jgi:hypothetical protein